MKTTRRKYVHHRHPLRTEIYRQGWGMKEFAAHVGIDYCTLRNIFIGKTHTREDTINWIAMALDLPYERVEELCRH